MYKLKQILSSIRFKIILVLGVAYLLIKFLSPQIFLAETPKIRLDYFTNLANIPEKFIAFFKTQKANFNGDFANSNLLQSVSTGVKAYDDKEKNVVYIKYEKNAKFEKKILKAPDGREFEIYIGK